MITLPYGGKFGEKALIAYIKESGRKYIIQGQQSLSYANHTKTHSLRKKGVNSLQLTKLIMNKK